MAKLSTRPPKRPFLILTCEHAGNVILPRFRTLFADHAELLQTHRGYDLGALEVATRLALHLGAPLYAGTTSRLLIELNRTLRHRALFSFISTTLADADKQSLIDDVHQPHVRLVQHAIEQALMQHETVLHVGVHSFTPVLAGVQRNADMALLYDPKSKLEHHLAPQWTHALRACAGTWRIRRNYPYRGASDGLTTGFRRHFGTTRYAGFEVEINQLHSAHAQGQHEAFIRLATSLQSVVLGA